MGALLPVAASLVLFLSGAIQMHPPIGWVDPGLYISWFLTPAENLLFRGPDYHGSRLAFVLPGMLLYRLFNAATAQAVLVGGFHVLGTVAIYALAATRLRTTAARVGVTLLVVLNPLWLAAFMRGYVDGPAMALGLGTLACVLADGVSRRRAVLVAGGALLILTACLHPLVGGIVGLTALAALVPVAGGVRALVASGAWMLLGGVAATLLLATASWGIGLPFLFYEMALPSLRNAAEGLGFAFLLPYADWAPSTHRLIVVPLVAVLLLAGIPEARRGGRAGMALLACAAVPFLLLLAFEARASLLQFAFYGSYVLLSLVPAIILLFRAVEADPPRARPWLLPAAVAAVAVLCLAGGLALSLDMRSAPPFSALAWAAVAVPAALAAAAVATRRRRAALLLVAGSLGLAGAVNRDTATVHRLADGPDLRAQHRALGRVRQALDAAGVSRKPYLVWLGRDDLTVGRDIPRAQLYHLAFRGREFELNAFDSIGASLGWDVAALGFDLPRLAPGNEGGIGSGPLPAAPTHLIMLCAEAAGCEQGLRTLEARDQRTIAPRTTLVAVRGVPRFTLMTAAFAPGPDDVVQAIRSLPRGGPAGPGRLRDGAAIQAVERLACGEEVGVTCTFTYRSGGDEVRPGRLALRREGMAWRVERAWLPPEPDDLLQILRSPPGGPDGPRPGVAARTVENVVCDEGWEGATCAFLYRSSDGEVRPGRLALRPEGAAWRVESAWLPPGPNDLARVLQALLLDGPSGPTIRERGTTVRTVENIVCGEGQDRMACAFNYRLSTGESGSLRLLLRRADGIWQRSG